MTFKLRFFSLIFFSHLVFNSLVFADPSEVEVQVSQSETPDDSFQNLAPHQVTEVSNSLSRKASLIKKFRMVLGKVGEVALLRKLRNTKFHQKHFSPEVSELLDWIGEAIEGDIIDELPVPGTHPWWKLSQKRWFRQTSRAINPFRVMIRASRAKRIATQQNQLQNANELIPDIIFLRAATHIVESTTLFWLPPLLWKMGLDPSWVAAVTLFCATMAVPGEAIGLPIPAFEPLCHAGALGYLYSNRFRKCVRKVRNFTTTLVKPFFRTLQFVGKPLWNKAVANRLNIAFKQSRIEGIQYSFSNSQLSVSFPRLGLTLVYIDQNLKTLSLQGEFDRNLSPQEREALLSKSLKILGSGAEITISEIYELVRRDQTRLVEETGFVETMESLPSGTSKFEMTNQAVVLSDMQWDFLKTRCEGKFY